MARSLKHTLILALAAAAFFLAASGSAEDPAQVDAVEEVDDENAKATLLEDANKQGPNGVTKDRRKKQTATVCVSFTPTRPGDPAPTQLCGDAATRYLQTHPGALLAPVGYNGASHASNFVSTDSVTIDAPSMIRPNSVVVSPERVGYEINVLGNGASALSSMFRDAAAGASAASPGVIQQAAAAHQVDSKTLGAEAHQPQVIANNAAAPTAQGQPRDAFYGQQEIFSGPPGVGFGQPVGLGFGAGSGSRWQGPGPIGMQGGMQGGMHYRASEASVPMAGTQAAVNQQQAANIQQQAAINQQQQHQAAINQQQDLKTQSQANPASQHARASEVIITQEPEHGVILNQGMYPGPAIAHMDPYGGIIRNEPTIISPMPPIGSGSTVHISTGSAYRAAEEAAEAAAATAGLQQPQVMPGRDIYIPTPTSKLQVNFQAPQGGGLLNLLGPIRPLDNPPPLPQRMQTYQSYQGLQSLPVTLNCDLRSLAYNQQQAVQPIQASVTRTLQFQPTPFLHFGARSAEEDDPLKKQSSSQHPGAPGAPGAELNRTAAAPIYNSTTLMELQAAKEKTQQEQQRLDEEISRLQSVPGAAAAMTVEGLKQTKQQVVSARAAVEQALEPYLRGAVQVMGPQHLEQQMRSAAEQAGLGAMRFAQEPYTSTVVVENSMRPGAGIRGPGGIYPMTVVPAFPQHQPYSQFSMGPPIMHYRASNDAAAQASSATAPQHQQQQQQPQQPAAGHQDPFVAKAGDHAPKTQQELLQQVRAAQEEYYQRANQAENQHQQQLQQQQQIQQQQIQQQQQHLQQQQQKEAPRASDASLELMMEPTPGYMNVFRDAGSTQQQQNAPGLMSAPPSPHPSDPKTQRAEPRYW